jgi:DNA-binding response OmpR family regulator
MRFLLVDDDPHVGLAIRHVAESCGFEVRTTHRADGFKDAYEDFHPDVITLDLGFPHGDGIELLRYLADDGCNAHIVIVSGFDERVLDAAKRLGEARGLKMSGTISKPMRLAQLRTIFNELGRNDCRG